MRYWPVGVLGIAALLVACSGSSKDKGAPSPEQAVQRLLDGLTAGKDATVLAAFEPERRDEPFSAISFGGLSRPLRAAWSDRKSDDAKVLLSDVKLSTSYMEDKAYATVRVRGRMVLEGQEARQGGEELDQTLLVVQLDDGWYVTTWENAYWKDVRKQQAEQDAAARDPVVAAFQAQLDSDAAIPGTYVAPHPGADGQLCSDRTCSTTMDDRRHVANFATVPLCTAQQIASGKISDPVCYHSNPPTSGPHAQSPAPFRVLPSPAPKEALVHNMEHGGVVVWYNTTDLRVVIQLADIVNAELNRQRLVVMSLYTEMEPDTIALTSWTRLDKFSVKDFSEERVQRFISRNSKRFNPEGF
ncbi:MAG TPA: DUF3105 domain-containing protein [Dehalococcoidia bacterium]|nr:DUF3105 domain-containing protein [Dehalococcoidia bacterium]